MIFLWWELTKYGIFKSNSLKYENCGLWWFSLVIFLWWELTKYGIFKSNSSLKIWKLWLMMSFSCDFPLMETDKILNSQIKFFKNMKIVACHDFLLWFSFDGNFKIWKLWLMMIFSCDFPLMETDKILNSQIKFFKIWKLWLMMSFFCNFPLMGTLKYENCGLWWFSPVIFLWWKLTKY